MQISHQKGKCFVGLIHRPTSMIMYTVANTMSMIVDRIQELQHRFSNFNSLHQLQRNQRQTGRSSEWPPQCAFLFHYFEAQCKRMPEDRSQVNAIVHTNVRPLSSHPLKVFAEKKSARWPSRSSVHQTDPTDLDNKVSGTQADLHIQKIHRMFSYFKPDYLKVAILSILQQNVGK